MFKNGEDNTYKEVKLFELNTFGYFHAFPQKLLGVYQIAIVIGTFDIIHPMEIKVKSIGVAKNQEKKHFGGWHEVVIDLIIDKKYTDALEGLKDYSHLIVVYWMHEVNACDIRLVPQGKKGKVPEVGIFACRCPQRPNPIGISTVELLGIKGNKVDRQGSRYN